MSSAEDAPYLSGMKAYLARDVLAFQVPGHMGNRGMSESFKDLMGETAFAADLTEVLTLDDLHRPLGQCGRAQQLAAKAFGADETHFLVNGSTCGVQAMLLATLGPEDTVLVPRNAHRSLWGGLMLCGASAVVYRPSFDTELGVFSIPTPEIVQEAMEANPEAKAIFITTPTYYGHIADIRAIVELAHYQGLLVLVDEAWGAHLVFHPGLPTSALRAGADLVVQSTHKMLSSLTQSAMLHVNGERVDRARLNLALRVLQSSSPSALLVASLDAARQQFQESGQELLQQALDLADFAVEELNKIFGAHCVGGRLRGLSWDPCHLFLKLDGYTGYQLEEALFVQAIAVELAEPAGVLILIGPFHQREDVYALLRAIGLLAKGIVGKKPGVAANLSDSLLVDPCLFGQPKLAPREAFFASTKLLDWQDAGGLVSAEAVTLYPPGIPWLLPGETIELEVVKAMRARVKAGARIQGASDLSLEKLRVVSCN